MRKFINNWIQIATLCSVLLLQAHSLAACPNQDAANDKKKKPPTVLTEDPEIRLGRENAEENDKRVRLITDAAVVERVNKIGQELAALVNKTAIPAKWGSSQLKPFNYTFKVVDDKDVNAYSLPGGFIYVNKGLLDWVRSDDELAGVLAHEIIHAAHSHMMKLLKEQSKIQNVLLPAIALAAVLGRSGGDVGSLVLGSDLFLTAKLNTYGIEAEKDADNGGLILLRKSRFNPVGLYSFMIRLSNEERNRGNRELGIFRTHPPAAERVQSVKEILTEWNIPLDLSKVDPSRSVTVQIKKGAAKGKDVAELSIRGLTLCKLVSQENQPLEDRAKKVANSLTEMFDRRLQPFEAKLNSDRTRLMVRNLVVLNDDDAKAQETTLDDMLKSLSATISQFNLRRQLEESGTL